MGIAVLGACVAQSSGRIIADTKLDLAVDPWRLIVRSTHLWDPTAFGQIQNQSAGYLFPAAPFFLAARLAHLPPWFTQRLWIAAVVFMAGWGAKRLADALAIGGRVAGPAAAAAYALSPALLTSAAVTSVGMLPYALLPWVLIPLARLRTGSLSIRRAAALSALAVAAMGGVNAASTFAALPMAILFITTRSPGSLRRRLLAWWVGLTLLATAWWTIPLIFQQRYGFNFLPLTERASTTAVASSGENIARGTSFWLGHLFVSGHPWLTAGWIYANQRLVGLAAGTVAAIGLAGLARRDLVERRFLSLTAGLTFTCLAFAYAGRGGSPFGRSMQALLDGPASPFRNLDKFQPGFRLALALGFGGALAGVRSVAVRRGAVGLSAVLFGLVSLPVLQDRLANEGAFPQIPHHWQQAANWIDRNSHGQRTLILPAAGFGEYRWGRPLDEPMQVLAHSAWATRNLIPLGSTANTRLLDAIDEHITRGEPVPGLAQVLADAGVGLVLIRNDLDPARTGAPVSAVVRTALARSPGLERVKEFGTYVPKGPGTEQLIADLHRAYFGYSSIEVWKVTGGSHAVRLDNASSRTVVAGGPESALTLASAGLTRREPPILASAADDNESVSRVATDDVRARSVQVGVIRNRASYSLIDPRRDPLTGESLRTPLALDGEGPRMAHTILEGARSIRASRPVGASVILPENDPVRAFDGDPATSWIDAGRRSAGQWIDLTLNQPIATRSLAISLTTDRPDRALATGIVVTTDGRSARRTLKGTGERQTVSLPAGRFSHIRISVWRVRSGGTGFGGVGIQDIDIPGVHVSTRTLMPHVPGHGPLTNVMTRQRQTPMAIGRQDEESTIRRRLKLEGGTQQLTGEVAFARDVDPNRLLPTAGFSVSASSRWGRLLNFAEQRAFDGDPDTAWVADPFDASPTLHLSWPSVQTIDRISLAGFFRGPFRTPTRVRLLADGQSRDVQLGYDESTFTPVDTTSLTVIVKETTSSTANTFATPAPVAVAELSFGRARPAPLAPSPQIDIPCGQGPVISIGRQRISTRVHGSMRRALSHDGLRLEGCDVITGHGTLNLDVTRDGVFDVNSLVVAQKGPDPRPSPTRVLLSARLRADRHEVAVGPGPASILSFAENTNRGWRATLNGHELKPLTVGGWRRGYLLPAGRGGIVHEEFAPERAYRAGLLAGVLGLLGLLGLALFRRSPRPAGTGLGASEPDQSAHVLSATVGVAVAGLVSLPLTAIVAVLAVTRRWRDHAPTIVGAAATLASLLTYAATGPGIQLAGLLEVSAQALIVSAVLIVTLAGGPAVGRNRRDS